MNENITTLRVHKVTQAVTKICIKILVKIQPTSPAYGAKSGLLYAGVQIIWCPALVLVILTKLSFWSSLTPRGWGGIFRKESDNESLWQLGKMKCLAISLEVDPFSGLLPLHGAANGTQGLRISAQV